MDSTTMPETETPSSSTGSLLIRAPLTLDSDSEYELETASTVGGSSFNSYENNSELGGSEEGFLSGNEEFETGSEKDRPLDGDPAEGIELGGENNGGVSERYKIYVANKDDDDLDSLENSMADEEESGGVDVPVAQLSMDDEVFDEMPSDEDAGFSGVVKVPGSVESSPRVNMATGVEGEEDEEEEQPLVNSEVENGGLEDFVGEDKGLSLEESQKDDEDGEPSVDKSIPMETLGEERVESVHRNSDEIEENGSVTVSDSQPVVETSDEVVVSDMKESNDTNSVEVLAPMSIVDHDVKPGVEDIAKGVGEKGFLSDGDLVQLIFGSSEMTEQVANEVDSEARLETVSQQIVVDSDEEEEAESEYEEAKELLNSATLAALLKAAAGAESGGVGLTITSPDGSKVFPLDGSAHSGSFLQSSKVIPPSNVVDNASKGSISHEDKQRFEKLQRLRVKFLRLVQRLGHSHADPMVAQVLYRLAIAAGSLFSREFTLESAKRAATQLEAEGKDDLDFSLNIVVLGKTGVGKSASINSILCEQKLRIDAFEPATTSVKEIVGTVYGVKMRILDTPGLQSPMTDEGTNRKVLASIKRFIRKFPPDVVLYVDRLDAHDKDLTDFLLLKSLTDSLGSSIWQNAIVTLTHAASASPEGPMGEPLSFEVFVAQRSHVIHRAISQAVGDLRLMNPSMMHPVALVENHPSCPRDGNGEILLPNGQSWMSQLLLLCYSVKILSEADSLSKPREQFDHQKLFGFRLRSPPLAYLLSSLLQSRSHLKLPNNEGSEDVDLDTELGGWTYSDEEDNDEYDQLPPFKPLKRSEVDKLSKEERKAYYEEYDYRVKLLQKKQWREEVKRMREIKKKGKDGDDNNGYIGDDGNAEEGNPATIPVPLPDMVLPPSFDGDNPTYRYRFLDSASQLLSRPVLDSQPWDHDIGYDGVSLERSLAIAGYYPGAFAVQITKDKREFNIHLDSSVCTKHGENVSTMAGLDVQTVGKQLAYIFRGETKFRNLEINRTTAGLLVTFLGENVATGLKIEDQIAVSKRLLLAGTAGAMRCQGDTAYGTNIEFRLKDKDFPVEQNQTTFGLSLVKWRRDLHLMANLQSQFSIGQRSSVTVRVGLNNKQSGHINIKTSSSDQLHIALVSFLPIAASICRMVYPGSDSKSSAC
ncbi:translocase of chloroplast 159, chloroplastic isoform X1 [Gossypium australe]|uniref:Translocase of chloroplast 159, chloroplastic isoform X1 n=1 Tax=Gossypium australe TaxID=47621 RepID=A0A5B6UG20_9ROSI|nr:translocase of chloroplast 159, chloroplastic isoform X1 [Gossypium australe]